MRTIKVGNNEYQLEFTFEAAECKDLIQKMFSVMSLSYLYKDLNASELENGSVEEVKVGTLFNGASEMVADMPHICYTAFYAGLLEHNPLTMEEAKNLVKMYLKENGLSFKTLYETLKGYMEEDGFFELSGLTEMLQAMNGASQKKEKVAKTPQDHKKSTSTK